MLHALASNTLADVKDVLKCPKDLEVPGDFSLNPSAVSTTSSASQLFPSSLFFIEDKFYIDQRNIKAKDYSGYGMHYSVVFAKKSNIIDAIVCQLQLRSYCFLPVSTFTPIIRYNLVT